MHDSQVYQTDGRTDRRTDILVANAVLNYFMQLKVTELIGQSLLVIQFTLF